MRSKYHSYWPSNLVALITYVNANELCFPIGRGLRQYRAQVPARRSVRVESYALPNAFMTAVLERFGTLNTHARLPTARRKIVERRVAQLAIHLLLPSRAIRT
jgi:hypothetical protein